MKNNSKHRDSKALLKNAYIELKKMRDQLDAIEHAMIEPIAIIGMGCRFPGGANNPDAYWQILSEGKDAVTEVPADRWNVDAYYDPNPESPGKMYTRYGGFLDQIDQFDPQFFGLSPREAVHMDPQQRLLLEVSWEALEYGGIDPSKLSRSQTGMYLGISHSDYAQLLRNSGNLALMNAYDATGNGHCLASGRVSYLLGLQGPNMALDTGCSSSLVAIHLACQSLRTKECDLALAGGVQLIISPETSILFCKLRAMSPDGRCKAFDASADGFGRGEGCGIVVLKRLSDAIADKNDILALIRGSAVNHDGPSSGLTVPNGLAQQAVIRQALSNANVQPSQISYVETHGTGTALGDPIELRALGSVIKEARSSDHPLMIGTVKTNFAHLEAAAGVAGIIKVVLSLQHQEIPPHLHFSQPSPHIPWDELPLRVVTEKTPWISEDTPRIAGVSSFGLGGTNAHIVLEEIPDQDAKSKKSLGEEVLERPLHLLTLSAKTEEALQELASRYEKHLAPDPNLGIENVCFTANAGRAHFTHRLGIIATSTRELHQQLSDFIAGRRAKEILTGQVKRTKPPQLVFLFTGQGSQYIGMGHELYNTQPTFRQTLDHCNEILRPYLEKPLLEVLYPEKFKSSKVQKLKNSKTQKLKNSIINQTAYTQPAIFAIEYALAELWKSWGIAPKAVLGHSVGEYVAACVAGVFSLEDGLKLIAERARLMQALPQDGQMVAVFADEAVVSDAIQPYAQDVSIAAINGPKNVVISGRREAVETITTNLQAEEIKTTPLNVSHAFHSPLMEPMLKNFEQVAREISFSLPKIDMISNLSGKLATEGITTPEYWCQHIRQPVRFAASIETLLEQGYEVFLEIGPKPILLGLGRQIHSKLETRNSKLETRNSKLETRNSLSASSIQFLPSLRQERSDWQQLLQSLGELYIFGASVDWEGFDRDYPRRRITLPTYPFQRQRYWIDVEKKPELPLRGDTRKGETHPLLGHQVYSAMLQNGGMQFKVYISQDSPAFLKDHCIFQKVIMPTPAYLEMAIAAGSEFFKTDQVVVEDLIIQQAVILEEDETKTIQVIVTPEEDLSGQSSPDRPQKCSFRIFSLTLDLEDKEPSWALHVSGKVLAEQRDSEIPPTDLTVLQARCPKEIPKETFYQRFRERGFYFGRNFQGVQQLRIASEEALGFVQLPKETAFESKDYTLHPALLDSAIHVGAALLYDKDTQDAYLPIGVERLRVYRPAGSCVWSHVRVPATKSTDQETITFKEIRLFTSDGVIIAEIEGLLVKKASLEAMMYAQESWRDWIYHMAWQPQKRITESDIAEESSTPRRWLIFADNQGIGSQLAVSLKAKGEMCTLVYPDKEYEQIGDQEFRINPGILSDFEQLIQHIVHSAMPPLYRVVHLWSLDIGETSLLSIQDLDPAGQIGCGSVLYLIQALVKAGLSQSPSLWLVTQNAQPTGDEVFPLAVAQAPLWGMGRSIALEHPDLLGGMIDLAPGNTDENAAMLLTELWNPDRENQIAFRENQRYIARLVAGTQQEAHEISLQPDATYLITGGFGALGLHIAQWMAVQGAKHLVLSGRRGAVSEAARDTINVLRQNGAQVHTIKADVSNQEDASGMIEEINASMPPLKGIIHAAGVLNDAVLLQQTWEQFRQVMKPKVDGAWNLHLLTQDLALDFFVCFSSAASLLGSPGQGNYAAANAFMDAFAHYRHMLGLPGLSINWGPWSGTGMAARQGSQTQFRWTIQGIRAITIEQGLQILDNMLKQNVTQVGAIQINWAKFLQIFPPDEYPPLLSEFIRQRDRQRDQGQPIASQRKILRQLEEASYEERHSLLIMYIQTQTAEALRLDGNQVDIKQPLYNMGFDSLMAIELRNQLKTDLGIEISMVKFMEGVSIEELAAHISEQFAQRSSVIPPQLDEQIDQIMVSQDMQPENAVQLLTQLDKLDEKQVDQLLRAMLSEEENNHE